MNKLSIEQSNIERHTSAKFKICQEKTSWLYLFYLVAISVAALSY